MYGATDYVLYKILWKLECKKFWTDKGSKVKARDQVISKQFTIIDQ